MFKRLVFGAVLCVAFDPAFAETVSSTAFTDYAPYTTDRDANGGFSTALVAEAFSESSVTVEHEWLPWARGYTEVLNGAKDITHPYKQTPERTAEMVFSDPVLVLPQRVFVATDIAVQPSSVEDLAGLQICVPIGYALPDGIEQLFTDNKAEHVRPKDIETCFRLLGANRTDCIITTPLIVQENINQGVVDAAMIRETEFDVDKITLHVIASQSHPRSDAIMAAFNEGLASLAQNGRLADLADDYGIPHSMLPALAP